MSIRTHPIKRLQNPATPAASQNQTFERFSKIMPHQELRIRISGPPKTLSGTLPIDFARDRCLTAKHIGLPETSRMQRYRKPAITKPTAIT